MSARSLYNLRPDDDINALFKQQAEEDAQTVINEEAMDILRDIYRVWELGREEDVEDAFFGDDFDGPFQRMVALMERS